MALAAAQRHIMKEPPRTAPPISDHVIQSEGWWRIAVPVEGTTQVFGPRFLNQATANTWVRSDYGQRAIARTLART